MEVPKYLIKIIGNYLSSRWRTVDGILVETAGGILQGTVLGSLLWIIFYKALLTIRVPVGFRLVAYLDDLGVVGWQKTRRY